MVRAQRALGLRSDHLFLLRHERSTLTASPSRAFIAQRRCSHGNYQSETSARGSTVAIGIVQLFKLLLFVSIPQLCARDR